MTTVVPHYAAGVDFDPARREWALDLMARLVEHWRHRTTDTAADQWREPVDDYLDENLWRREVEQVFHRRPIPVAVSAELPGPGSYKAVDVAGRRLLLTRDAEGLLHAHMNVCRHRGMQLVPTGCGTARRFSCAYHAWTYGLDGALLGVQAESTFGPVDRRAMGLLDLPCGERAGIVFAALTPDVPFDLDDWLGGLLPELELLDLTAMTPFSTRWLDGPNWKITADGFLEGYHFASLHPNSVARTNVSNMAAFDTYGPHVRNTFALKPIEQAAQLPREQWDPVSCLGVTYWLFPGLAIAGGWRQHTAVSIVLPGADWGSTVTQQTILLRRSPQDDAERAAAQAASDFFYSAFHDEDYTAQTAVQQGLPSVAGTSQLFGRNEPGVQHFHRTLNAFLAAPV